MQCQMYTLIEQMTGRKHPVLAERGRGWEEYDKRRAEYGVWWTKHNAWWAEYQRQKPIHKLRLIATWMDMAELRDRLDVLECKQLFVKARLGVD